MQGIEIKATRLNGNRETWISVKDHGKGSTTMGLGKILESKGVYLPANLKELVEKLTDGGASVTALAQAALKLATEPTDDANYFAQKTPQ